MIIIYSHPSRDGHCGAILSEVTAFLKEKGIKAELWDLYKMKFDPVIRINELYTAGFKDITPENLRLQEKIKDEDEFIFIFPVWWNGMPAILKGFFDRVFVSGFAFKYDGNKPIGLLNGDAVVFTSSGGPTWINRWFAGNRALKAIIKDTLKFCGINGKGFSVGDAMVLDDKKKAEIKAMVQDGLSGFQGQQNI